MEITAYHPFRSARAKERFLKEYDLRAKGWPVPSETVMADTSFGPTFVRISGKKKSPPLVLLHGGGGNSLQWIPNVEALSETYRVYAVDNIYDNGRSVYTRPIGSVDDFVDWLDELFTALDLGDRINLIGLSYGGWLAGWCAYRLSNRLDRVVLLAPAFTVLPLRIEFIIRAILCMVPLRFITRSFLSWLLSDFARSGESARALVKESADFAFTAFRSFKPRKIVKPTMLTDAQLGGLEVPILFLVGEHDRIYSARRAVERLGEVAPRIKAEIIPGAGHDLTLVRTDMVNRKVLEFLGQP
jgi:pimeloyl-ACP methyl ester carboxylesterase